MQSKTKLASEQTNGAKKQRVAEPEFNIFDFITDEELDIDMALFPELDMPITIRNHDEHKAARLDTSIHASFYTALQPLFQWGYAYFEDRDLITLGAVSRGLNEYLNNHTWSLKLQNDFGCLPVFTKKLSALSTSHCKAVHRRLRHLQVNFHKTYLDLKNIGFDFIPLYVTTLPADITPYLRQYYWVKAATYGNYALIKNELKPDIPCTQELAQAIYAGLVEFGDIDYLNLFGHLAKLLLGADIIINAVIKNAAKETSNRSIFTRIHHEEKNFVGTTNNTNYARSWTSFTYPPSFYTFLPQIIQKQNAQEIEMILSSLENIDISNLTSSKGASEIYRTILRTGNIEFLNLANKTFKWSNPADIAHAAASGNNLFFQAFCKSQNEPITEITPLTLIAAASSGNKIHYEQVKLLPLKLSASYEMKRFIVGALQRGHYELIKQAVKDILAHIQALEPSKAVEEHKTEELPDHAGLLIEIFAEAVQDTKKYYIAYQQMDKLIELTSNCKKDFPKEFSEKYDDSAFLELHDNAYADLYLILWYYFEAIKQNKYPIMISGASIDTMMNDLSGPTRTVDFTTVCYLMFMYELLKLSPQERQRLIKEKYYGFDQATYELFLWAGQFPYSICIAIIKYLKDNDMLTSDALLTQQFSKIFSQRDHAHCGHTDIFNSVIAGISPNKKLIQIAFEKWPLAFFKKLIQNCNELIDDSLLAIAYKTGLIEKIEFIIAYIPTDKINPSMILNSAIQMVHVELLKWTLAKYKITPSSADIKTLFLCNKLVDGNAVSVTDKRDILKVLCKAMAEAKKPFSLEDFHAILEELGNRSKKRITYHIDVLLKDLIMHLPPELRITINKTTVKLLKNVSKVAHKFAKDYLKRPHYHEKRKSESKKYKQQNAKHVYENEACALKTITSGISNSRAPARDDNSNLDLSSNETLGIDRKIMSHAQALSASSSVSNPQPQAQENHNESAHDIEAKQAVISAAQSAIGALLTSPAGQQAMKGCTLREDIYHRDLAQAFSEPTDHSNNRDLAILLVKVAHAFRRKRSDRFFEGCEQPKRADELIQLGKEFFNSAMFEAVMAENAPAPVMPDHSMASSVSSSSSSSAMLTQENEEKSDDEDEEIRPPRLK